MKRLIALILLIAAPASAELIGTCQFDRDTLTFAGSPLDQATCLLRKVEPLGVKSAQPLPPVLRQLMEQGGAPSAAQQAAALAAFPEPYRDTPPVIKTSQLRKPKLASRCCIS